MMIFRRVILIVSVVSVVTLGWSAAAVEVTLEVSETGGVARTGSPVTAGVPFARGAVKDAARLSAKRFSANVDGKAIPAQFSALASWDDGTVRWALMDVQADVAAGGKAKVVVSDAGGNPAPATPVKVSEGAESVRVSSGPLEFVVSRKKAGLFDSLKVDGRDVLTAAGRGLVLMKAGGGEVAAGVPTEVKVEQAGPLRAVVCVRGKFEGVHNGLLGYTVRATAFAGSRFVKLHVWIENNGAMGYYTRRNDNDVSKNMEWFYFDGLAVELGLGLGDEVAWSCEGVNGTGSVKVLQTCKMAKGQEKSPYKKGPFYTMSDMEYAVTSKGKEMKKGERTDGVVTLSGAGGKMTAAVRQFWQNYEKGMELDGKTFRAWLWPTEGAWPHTRPNIHSGELYDRDLQNAAKDGLYALAGGVHKGHEMILDFSGRDAAATLADLSEPVAALPGAEYVAGTEAAPGLFAPPDVRTGDGECDARLASWMRMTRSVVDPKSPASLCRARQESQESGVGYFGDTTYWYGWMDFGDISVPGSGMTSLAYDWTWVLLLNAVRTGDAAFLRMGAEMARHRIDVDQLWSDRDNAYVRALQRGASNFPTFHTNRLCWGPGVESNWLAGVALYYMLTGEPKALECARRNAEGLKSAWAFVEKTRPWGGPQGDMAAVAWTIESYCAMHALTGEKKWLGEATGLFDRLVVPKWKEMGPFLHEVGKQIQSQDYVKDDMRYCYAIEAFCQLHHLTGHAKVMELLKAGCEKELPGTIFFEAPIFVSGQYAYVGLKEGKKEYLAKAAEMFAQGFAESKCPPVYLTNNSTWNVSSAMTLRTGHLLQYAYWKTRK